MNVTIARAVWMGIFDSEAAARGAISRGELRKGIHYHQKRRGGRIWLDVEAVEDWKRQPPAPKPEGDVIPLARGGWMR